VKKRLRGAILLAIIGFMLALAIQLIELKGNSYYVDVGHANAQDSSDHGSINQPWKTLKYAFWQLQPGDTLLVRGGTYENATIQLTAQNSGYEGSPISVQAYQDETVILSNGGAISFQGANWWILDGLIFDSPKSQYIQLGLHEGLGHSQTVAAEHITIRNCEFKNGKRAVIVIHFAHDVLIENNYFHHVRPGTPFEDENGNKIGWEMSAIAVRYKGNNIVIKNNRFEEIGSDGVQLGSQSYRPGSEIGAVTFIGNEFWVNRPYTGILGNVGENGIDVKKVKGPILISGNAIHGFRPTTPEQDASGSNGAGIIIHNNAQNVIVEKNFFYDNAIHLVVSRGTDGVPGGTRNIVVRNNVFREATRFSKGEALVGGFALLIARADKVEVYHNTFYNNKFYLKAYGGGNVIFKNNVIIGGSTEGDLSKVSWEADYNAWSQIEGDVPLVLQGSHDLRISDPGP